MKRNDSQLGVPSMEGGVVAEADERNGIVELSRKIEIVDDAGGPPATAEGPHGIDREVVERALKIGEAIGVGPRQKALATVGLRADHGVEPEYAAPLHGRMDAIGMKRAGGRHEGDA